MADFISNVEQGAAHAGWLNPATVADLSDSDFVTLPREQREQLFRAVERFRTIAASGLPTQDEQTEARTALNTILEILRPYLTPESRRIREAIASAWRDERVRDWIPTFDYELQESWTGSPIVWVWLILRDDVDIEAPATREGLSRLRMLIRLKFTDAGIDRWPNIGIRTESEVQELAPRATA